MPTPVRYSPNVEHLASDEADTLTKLEEQFRHIQDTTAKDYSHGVRAVHAKAHGIARGELTIAGDLSPELAQGLFARPGTYEAVIRISTNPGDLLDDSIGLPRGLALKVIGVEGARLPGSEGDATQDFVLVNGPAFAAPTPKAFLGNLTTLAKTTDTAEGAKKAVSSVLRVFEAGLEAVGHPSAMLQNMGGAPNVHPLGETYYSQTAFRFGDYIAKFRLKPTSRALTSLTGDTIDASDRPDALREEVRRQLIETGGTWALEVQLCTDLDKMPVEDPTVPWDEKASPFHGVATLEIPPQLAWENGVTNAADDALAFSPWHGLAAHQPLGGVNRVRRETYEKSAEHRGRVNGCPMHEPKALAEVP